MNIPYWRLVSLISIQSETCAETDSTTHPPSGRIHISLIDLKVLDWKEIGSPDNECLFTKVTRVSTELCCVGVVCGVQDAMSWGYPHGYCWTRICIAVINCKMTRRFTSVRNMMKVKWQNFSPRKDFYSFVFLYYLVLFSVFTCVSFHLFLIFFVLVIFIDVILYLCWCGSFLVVSFLSFGTESSCKKAKTICFWD